MLIDWFTVGAQALNFLILVWLMKRFLYKPILDAIDARENRIATELADADAKKAEAHQERDDFQKKNAEFEQQRATRLSAMTEEIKVERQHLLDAAQQAADTLSAKRSKALIDEAQNLNHAISNKVQREVFAIARKALADLATASLEESMAEVFVRRLREMNGAVQKTLGEALKTSPEPALVRSAFELPAAQCDVIQKACNEIFAVEISLRFETAPNQISGIELTCNGQKLAWSIADYLQTLEQRVGEVLQSKVGPADTAAEARPISAPQTS